MKVAAVMDDLMLFSRIDAATRGAGGSVVRVSSPSDVPSPVDLVLVDWSERSAGWADELARLRDAHVRVVLFGRHTDIESHRSARDAGLGPMWARSKLVADLSELLA